MRMARLVRLSGAARWLAAALVVTHAGCTSPPPPPDGPVVWEPDRRIPGAMAPGATMVLVDGGIPAMQPAWNPVRWPDDSLACAGSFAVARARADTMFAVWRAATTDSTQLWLARSGNGGLAWEAPVAIGPAEQFGRGCRRPPAGMAVDTLRGVVHVAYYGAASRATGIVTIHIARDGQSVSKPELIARGDVPTVAAIAARGDTVAIVFEAPVSPGGIIWLALSTHRRQISPVRMPLSTPGVRASVPGVALAAGRVGAAWNEGRHGTEGPAAVARVGRLVR
jgi:hypothetical protein